MAFDVAIIGGGPGGYTAAAEAAGRGLSTVLFEGGELGGTCLNRGCIPTKALLHEAEAGVTDAQALIGKRDATVTALRTGVEKLMKARKVTVVNGFAQITGPGAIACNGEAFEARDIVVATGSVPSVPPIPGADLPGVYTVFTTQREYPYGGVGAQILGGVNGEGVGNGGLE
ncbi:MAG: NAD(P)/FAD-dependent oxidoreductase, partial [Atopobiaceae bacterium]|nr:NAD(P)/FAD-dependent oxidoreductase [Atopobiaceae bacterium]